MAQNRPDVAIVGAGFAGLCAAEAVTAAGLSWTLLEARDRIGGRAWTRTLPGTSIAVEMGAEWMSPTLHRAVNALAHRIGDGLEAGPRAHRGTWIVNGRRFTGDLAEHAADRPSLSGALARLRADMARVGWDRRTAAPSPFAGLTVAAYLDALAADPMDRALLTAALWPLLGGRPEGVGAEAVLRTLRGHGAAPLDGLLHPMVRIAGGAGGLAERLAEALGPGVLLGRPVTAIEQDHTEVRLHGSWGTVPACTAIVAVPLNALDGIAFSPALSRRKADLAAETHAGSIHKAWARVTSRRIDLVSRAWPAAVPLAYTRGGGPDGTALCAQMPTGTMSSGAAPAALAAALAETMPALEIAAVLDHDWTADRWARGSGFAARPGQTAAVPAAFADPDGRVHFAGGDLSPHWSGWIDGAITSGQETAARVITQLT